MRTSDRSIDIVGPPGLNHYIVAMRYFLRCAFLLLVSFQPADIDHRIGEHYASISGSCERKTSGASLCSRMGRSLFMRFP
jgi:hypothetical protein